MPRKKLPRNWWIEKTLLWRRKWSNSTKDDWIFCAALSVSLEQWVYHGIRFGKYKNDWNLLDTRKSSKILTHRSVLGVTTFRIKLFITSRSRKPGRESRMQRNTREDISIPGCVFLIVNQCLMNYIWIREIWHHHREFREEAGIEKSGSEEPLQPIPLPCFSVRAREKSLDRQKLSNVSDQPCRGYRDLYSKWHDNSELSFLGDAPGKIRIVNFWEEVCPKAKNPTLALRWIKEIEAAKSLDEPHHSEVNNGQRFPWFVKDWIWWWGAPLVRCHDKQTHFRKIISVEEQRAQKDNRFLRGRQIASLICEYFSTYWILWWNSRTIGVVQY